MGVAWAGQSRDSSRWRMRRGADLASGVLTQILRPNLPSRSDRSRVLPSDILHSLKHLPFENNVPVAVCGSTAGDDPNAENTTMPIESLMLRSLR
jgi:hypothetical protein